MEKQPPKLLPTRRHFLSRTLAATLGTTALGAAWSFGIEPKSIETTFVDLPIPNLHRRWDAMRIALLADLHASSIVAPSTLRHAFEIAARLNPATIVVAGDWVSDAANHIHEILPAINAVPGKIPILGILGNHDYNSHRAAELADTLASRLQEAGVNMLRNNTWTPGDGLTFLGLEDLLRGNINLAAFAPIPARHRTIVLAHNPDCADTFANQPWDVMLSGHTHGGQVLIPLLGPMHLPVKNKLRYSGMYRPDSANPSRLLYVNRGIGSYVHVRFNCPPEVTCLTLRSC